MACPTCSTGSPSAWCASRRASAGPANPDADRLLDAVRARGIPVRTTAAPESWEPGGVRIAVRHPPVGWYLEAPDNARSLVLDVAHDGRHLLLTGDLEQHRARRADRRTRTPTRRRTSCWRRTTAAGPPTRPRSTSLGRSPGRRGQPACTAQGHRRRPDAPRTAGHPPLADLARRCGPTAMDGRRHRRQRIPGPGRILDRTARRREVRRQPGSSRPLPLALIAMGPWPIGFRVAIGLAGFAIGAILWVVVTIVEFGAWTLVVPPRGDGRRRPDGESGPGERPRPPASPNRSRPRRPTACAWRGAGIRLRARWHGSRTVLLLHGFAEDPSAWEAGRASILNRHGWNVAALDSRGYGRSGGLHASFGGREAGDIAAWLDAIAARPAALDPTVAFRAAVWGRSMGAAIAMRAAAENPRIAALVLESPMVDLDRSVAGLLRKRGLRCTGVLARLITGRAGRIAGVPLRRPRPLDVAPRVTCRTLIVHGTDDWLVPAAEVRRLADALPTPPWPDRGPRRGALQRRRHRRRGTHRPDRGVPG